MLSLIIKFPIYPFHIWLPIVHVESPTIRINNISSINIKNSILWNNKICITNI